MSISAIFDNTVFNIAARIACCDLIALSNNLFDNILVPEEIYEEIQAFPQGHEPQADRRMGHYLRSISPRFKGLQLCTTYDPIVLANLQGQEGIDKGEAEAIAQALKRGAYWFFTDDERAIKVLSQTYTQISFLPTLFLISLLEVKGFLVDYPQILREYLAYKPFKKKEEKKWKAFFRAQYIKALAHYGLNCDKKRISDKTSLKKLQISIL